MKQLLSRCLAVVKSASEKIARPRIGVMGVGSGCRGKDCPTLILKFDIFLLTC